MQTKYQGSGQTYGDWDKINKWDVQNAKMKTIKTETATQDQGVSVIDVESVVHDTLRKESNKVMVKSFASKQSECTWMG